MIIRLGKDYLDDTERIALCLQFFPVLHSRYSRSLGLLHQLNPLYMKESVGNLISPLHCNLEYHIQINYLEIFNEILLLEGI